MNLKACHCCGLIHRLPELDATQVACCTRCGDSIASIGSGRRVAARSGAAALGALVLFFPAILLPILEIEKLGHTSQSSILGGTIELFANGSWFVGSVVLVFSIIFPLAKILFLLELNWLGWTNRHVQSQTYRVMEHAGKWSMMDVLLLSFMVMLIKLGELVTFHFGPGVFAFVLCVVMSLVASITFDPLWIWESDDE